MAYRKLLILTYHFPPSAASGSFRLLGFIRHLPRFGWRTVVVAPPSLPYEPIDRGLLSRVPPETAVYRIGYPEGLLSKPIRKYLPFGVWLPLAAASCYRAIRAHRPDVVLTSGPPHTIHLLGRHLRHWMRLPWVADFRDPWVAGNSPNIRGPVARWERTAEPSVMRQANAIILNTPGVCELLSSAYPQYASKMASITNGYDPEPLAVNPIAPLSGPTIEVVHTGEVYASRSPKPFLDAVGELDPAALGGRTLRVRFIGKFGVKDSKDQIETMSRQGSRFSVSLEDHVPYLQSIWAISQADLLLLLDTPGRRTGVPAKLYEYIGARRPILALAEPESDVAWVLRESGVPHRIAPPLETEAIGGALMALLRDPASVRCGAQQQPLETRFTREYLAGELAAVLDSILRRDVKGGPCAIAVPEDLMNPDVPLHRSE
jgi:glycosyltransferase involved in cell wall biosynthesis